ncbi:hypothetical protein A1F99_078280 [Pyrenophora tritici-repentis]|nr:hypothetical protein A1F99_078280 [Pyrenophora tritici-repentis]
MRATLLYTLLALSATAFARDINIRYHCVIKHVLTRKAMHLY